jgi:methylated-DNA-[protein]-cysteine S-methyltransferase
MEPIYWTIHESPLGPLTVLAGEAGVRSVRFPDRDAHDRLDPRRRRPLPRVAEQLDEYFAGERRDFELDLDLGGKPLQLAVWERLREIPYGETKSYGELAAEIDGSLSPTGVEPHRFVRRVAAEVGRTPTPVQVPCHRVIGADGSLTGYGGGLDRKRALLDLERRVAGPPTAGAAEANVQLALL